MLEVHLERQSDERSMYGRGPDHVVSVGNKDSQEQGNGSFV